MRVSLFRNAPHYDMCGLFLELLLGLRPTPAPGELRHRITLIVGVGQYGIDIRAGRQWRCFGLWRLWIIPAWEDALGRWGPFQNQTPPRAMFSWWPGPQVEGQSDE